MNKPRIIAFYLPQFHPFPENDKWWGKGFTEWTNVAKAKPLFKGHYQPRIPADLGFYDLRVPEVRIQQAELAKEAGIEGFCYYHYWFGSKNNPKELMQMPFNEVVKSKSPDFPFCICWANHSFEKRDWDASTSFFNRTVLVEQQYYGIEDYTEHFYSLLEAFKDERYIKVDNKLLFVIYNPKGIPDVKEFIDCWNELANKNNIPNFYFVMNYQFKDDIDSYPNNIFDAKICDMVPLLTNDRIEKKEKIIRYIKKTFALLLHYPIYKMEYKNVIKKLIPTIKNRDDIIPEILSGFDHSPRTKNMRLILNNYTPDEFKNHCVSIFEWKKRYSSNDLIFLKSWNEWGEGNYMEPDLKYGKAFIRVLKELIDLY
ncbi:MAG: glycoside hydrolase family 99-like domain-containing protein [Treponema sp.]|nr:glycoside hydrolase family 99-like domain-containing protein [Treponema sp.]